MHTIYKCIGTYTYTYTYISLYLYSMNPTLMLYELQVPDQKGTSLLCPMHVFDLFSFVGAATRYYK